MLRRRSTSILVLLVLARAARAQLQDVTFDNPVDVTSSTPVAVATLVVPGSGVSDVALTAHVYLEGAGFAYDSYAIRICKDSAAGVEVGEAEWRPGDRTPASGTFEADTVLVTGFDRAVLPATYVLCANKTGAASPDVTAYVRGFNAETAAAGTTLSGFEAHGLVEIQEITSTTWDELGRITVDGGAGSDFLLTAHAVVVGLGLGGGYSYQFGICKETAGGTLVGNAVWRPPLAADAGASTGDTVSLTGFDTAVSGVAHYVLCARKIDPGAPTLDGLALGIHAVRAPAGTTAFGAETTGFTTPTVVDSTSFASAASLAVDGVAPFAVRLTAHAYLETQNFGASSRYEIGICRGSASGAMVGRALWRPMRQTSDAHFIGDTLALTGYDRNVSGPTTYVLCVRKYDPTAPTVTAYADGLVATVPEPGATAAGVVVAGLLALGRGRRADLGATKPATRGRLDREVPC